MKTKVQLHSGVVEEFIGFISHIDGGLITVSRVEYIDLNLNIEIITSLDLTKDVKVGVTRDDTGAYRIRRIPISENPHEKYSKVVS